MNLFAVPWIELALLVPLLGALCVCRVRDPIRASLWCLLFTGTAFGCTFLAWLAFYLRHSVSTSPHWSLQQYLLGRQLFGLDELSAPLLPMVALLHFLTVVATNRTKMRRYSFTWSMAAETIRLATFCSPAGWMLVGLLCVSTVMPYIELVNRGKPTRVYVLHMGLFVGLLVMGWAFVEADGGRQTLTAWASVPLLAAILVRCGTIPVHCWVTDFFEHSSFGIALLYVAPIAGVYAAVRLVLPIAPDWVLHSLGLISLATAVYSAGMAVVQRETRRFFAYFLLSHSSLVLVGLDQVTSHSLAGALCLWFSVSLSLGGFGLTLRALESRFGRLALADFHGLYEHSPALAVCFLLTGLATVGFPGTLGYVSADLLIDGVVSASPYVGYAIAVVAALNGIAVLRAYLLLFTGTRHVSTVSLNIGLRERFAVLTLATLILGGGLYPQPGVLTRHHAAENILQDRENRARAATLKEEERLAEN